MLTGRVPGCIKDFKYIGKLLLGFWILGLGLWGLSFFIPVQIMTRGILIMIALLALSVFIIRENTTPEG